jgi:hypothetical protein
MATNVSPPSDVRDCLCLELTTETEDIPPVRSRTTIIGRNTQAIMQIITNEEMIKIDRSEKNLFAMVVVILPYFGAV